MQNHQLVPQTGNLEGGFRALQHAPQLCVCRDPQGPAGPAEARGRGEGVWVGRWEETRRRPCPELRAARPPWTWLCLWSATRCASGEPGWACGTRVPSKDPGWGQGVPRSQEAASPAAEATDEESSFFFQTEVQPLKASQCARGGRRQFRRERRLRQ